MKIDFATNEPCAYSTTLRMKLFLPYFLIQGNITLYTDGVWQLLRETRQARLGIVDKDW